MRMLLFELKPDALEATRLAELLQHASAALAARGDVELETEIDAAEPPAALRVQAYRIAQEALANVARHAGARKVRVAWQSRTPGRGRLVIADDGHGFDLEAGAPAGHFGLSNMKERAAAIGAELALDSAPGAGTRVELALQWN
jgi:signal transduction histidine kinase